MKRVILHCDLNCFFASVEMLYNPHLRNVPMAVAGDPKRRHGIILAKNVPAKQRGIKTAETINDAKKKCPELIIRKPDYDSYSFFSKRVRSLYYEFTDLVEPFGMDECWLDITSSIRYFGSVETIVSEILRRVREEIGLTLSIGVADNKVYAKLGSDLAKEDSAFFIRCPEDVFSLPAEDLLYVGKSAITRLHSHAIYTIGDIAKQPRGRLEDLLGKWGTTLWNYANGKDDSPVSRYGVHDDTVRSIGNSTTSVRDLYDMDDLKLVLTGLCDSVSSRLRKQGLYFRTVCLQLRDIHLHTRSIRTTLTENSDLGKTIFDCCIKLFQERCDFSVPYRSIGVSVSGLSATKDTVQLDLLKEEEDPERIRKKEQAMEEIRRRFGYHSVSTLRMLEDRELSETGTEDEYTFFPSSFSGR